MARSFESHLKFFLISALYLLTNPKNLSKISNLYKTPVTNDCTVDFCVVAEPCHKCIIECYQQENTSHIIGLLQKLKNETDSLVKTANIFSLAKKNHHNPDENNIEPVVRNFSDQSIPALSIDSF